MFLFFGTKFFGQVGTIENRIHIATRFHHIFLIPLIYQGAYIIVDDKHALRIPINLKSIAFAYLRLLLGVIIILATLILMMMLSSPHIQRDEWIIAACSASSIILAIMAAYYSFQFGKANAREKARIMELLEQNKAKIMNLGPAQVRTF